MISLEMHHASVFKQSLMFLTVLKGSNRELSGKLTRTAWEALNAPHPLSKFGSAQSRDQFAEEK